MRKSIVLKESVLAPFLLVFSVLFALSFFPVSLLAQDFDEYPEWDSGFGEDDSGFGFMPGGGIDPTVKVNGSVSAQLFGFGDDFSSGDKIKAASLGDIFSGNISFSSTGTNAEALINLNFRPVFDGSVSPVTVDEAFVKGIFGPVTIGGGLMKLKWGRADSSGPLDIVNPQDYTDLSAMTDQNAVKIARPLVQLVYQINGFTNIEAVFVPWFEGHRFALNGRWAPFLVQDYKDSIGSNIETAVKTLAVTPPAAWPSGIAPEILAGMGSAGFDGIYAYYADMDFALSYPTTNNLEYFQAGLRFATLIGPVNLGLQYYSGILPRPAITVSGTDTFLQNPYGITPVITYNRYHQIGVDYEQALGGFTIRAELAANITEDLEGTDGNIYNPSLAWSFGIDRTFWGLSVNLQVNENIVLLHDKVGDSIISDIEAGGSITSTRIILALSKTFFQEQLELRLRGIMDAEAFGFYILPGIVWTKGSLSAELSGGIFAGGKESELGQYHKNSYVKTLLTYSF